MFPVFPLMTPSFSDIVLCLGFVVPKTDKWTATSNYWKAALAVDCNEFLNKPGILTGMGSYHNNGQEDRRWKIQCSEVS